MRTVLAAFVLTMLTLTACVPPADAATPSKPAPAAVSTVPSWIAPGMIEPPVRHVARRHLTVEFTDRIARPGAAPLLLAEFNDGRMVAFRPCRTEDSSPCFWNHRTRGNHIGRSFIAYAGHLFFLDVRDV